jgi:hypothetical protein
MTHINHHTTNSVFLRLMDEFERFDGACDPAFDNDLEEMERQFAEFRLASANDLN